MKEFKFLNTNDQDTDYINVGHGVMLPFRRTEVERQVRPHGMSNRHWNLLPQDVRDGDEILMELYVDGWVCCRNNVTVNPYTDITCREMWNRGFMACRNRRDGNNPYYEAVREEINNIFNDEPQIHGFTVGIHNTQVVLEYRGDMDIESVRSMTWSLKYRYANYVSIGEQVLGFMEDYLNEHLNGRSIIRLA